MAKRIITTENLEEDSKIEGQLRPQLLSEYIGQEKAKKTLSIYIEAAKARGDGCKYEDYFRTGNRETRRDGCNSEWSAGT